MALPITALTAVLFLTGCAHAPVWHPQPAEKTFTPEFRQTDFRLRVHVLPASQIDRIQKVAGTAGVLGAAVPDPRAGACDIWIPRPVPLPGRLNGALAVAGHELWHCIVGPWHGSLPGTPTWKDLPPEFVSDLRTCFAEITRGEPHPKSCTSVVNLTITKKEITNGSKK